MDNNIATSATVCIISITYYTGNEKSKFVNACKPLGINWQTY